MKRDELWPGYRSNIKTCFQVGTGCLFLHTLIFDFFSVLSQVLGSCLRTLLRQASLIHFTNELPVLLPLDCHLCPLCVSHHIYPLLLASFWRALRVSFSGLAQFCFTSFLLCFVRLLSCLNLLWKIRICPRKKVCTVYWLSPASFNELRPDFTYGASLTPLTWRHRCVSVSGSTCALRLPPELMEAWALMNGVCSVWSVFDCLWREHRSGIIKYNVLSWQRAPVGLRY